MALKPIISNLLFGGNNDNRTTFSYSSNWKRSIFTDLNKQQFYEHFRMSKDSFHRICTLLHQKASQISFDEFKINMLLFLTYVGHSVVYRMVRELFGISLTSTFRRIEYFSKFLISVARDFIKLPTLEELPSLSEGFLILPLKLERF